MKQLDIACGLFYICAIDCALMEEKVTIHDIARMLKVSPSTVSRALNNNPRISRSMRDEIQKLANDRGYRPNILASSLRKGKSMTAGVVIPRINRFFFSGVIGGMEEILNTAGFNLMICQTLENYSKENENLKTLLNMQVDVIFISLSAGTVNTSHIRDIINRGKRVIMFDRVDENLDLEMVRLNDFQGAYNTVKHMLSQGYRRIVHFAGPGNLLAYRERERGYREALRDHDIGYMEVVPDIITRESGMEAMDSIILNKKMPDAVFAASDFSALGAILSARKHSIPVPSSIGIAGFANEPFTEFVHPGITTTDQKSRLMGQKIASLFLNDPEGNKKHREIIDPELIIRNSTLKTQT